MFLNLCAEAFYKKKKEKSESAISQNIFSHWGTSHLTVPQNHKRIAVNTARAIALGNAVV